MSDKELYPSLQKYSSAGKGSQQLPQCPGCAGNTNHGARDPGIFAVCLYPAATPNPDAGFPGISYDGVELRCDQYIGLYVCVVGA